MTDHKCRAMTGCICWTGDLEPDDNCPMHGSGAWPPQCEVCGRFLPWYPRDIEECLTVPECPGVLPKE